MNEELRPHQDGPFKNNSYRITNLEIYKRIKAQAKLMINSLFPKRQEIKIETPKQSKDFKILKDKYGEDFAKLCRSLFPTILEQEGALSQLILTEFAPNKKLYEDIVGMADTFREYIYKLYSPTAPTKTITQKSVRELLAEAGYDFYECHSIKEIQAFKKYYASEEELCTFSDETRHQRCHVFWAVKKDVKKIKRKNFPNPQRQDEYGTSVISIQFDRLTNRLSIKNRYNHTVLNPDATFSNNLENIIPGLTDAFEREFGLIIDNDKEAEFIREINAKFYVRANDNKLYSTNTLKGNIYYCPNNIIIDNGEVITLEKSRYILMDCYIFDKVNKRLFQYNSDMKEALLKGNDYLDKIKTEEKDSFLDGFKDLDKVEIDENGKKHKTKFTEQVDKETGTRVITLTAPNKEPITIKIDEFNRIRAYRNPNIIEVGDYFLNDCPYIGSLDLPNLKKAGHNFASFYSSLENLNLPLLETVGDGFLENNNGIDIISLPNLKTAGNKFLSVNQWLRIIDLPNLTEVGKGFLEHTLLFFDENIEKNSIYLENRYLKSVNLPKLEDIEIQKKANKIAEINSLRTKPKKRATIGELGLLAIKKVSNYVSNIKVSKRLIAKIKERFKLTHEDLEMERKDYDEEIGSSKSR